MNRADREVDDDDRREALDQRRSRMRLFGCACGYPDWPGQCPGTANCPLQQEATDELTEGK